MDRRDDPDAGDAPDDRDRRDDGASEGDVDESRSAASVATEGEEWRLTAEDLEREDELSPGDPDLENVLFVLLGVAFALGVLAQFVVALP